VHLYSGQWRSDGRFLLVLWFHPGKKLSGTATTENASGRASANSRSLAKNDALHWTPYMGECLTVLEHENESSLDAILVQQVKIDRVVEKANLALVRLFRRTMMNGCLQLTFMLLDQAYHATFEADNTGAALPSIYVQSMQADLDRLKHDLPHHLQQNGQ
jgi:hypothetical protein